MAAYSTGSDWSFPDDMPGTWTQEDVDAQIHGEAAQQRTPPNAENASHKKRRIHYPPYTCRICLEVVLPTFHVDDAYSALPEAMRPAPRVTYESPVGDGGKLIRPCKCTGTAKYVHEECLQAWRRQDPMQKRNYWQCPTCSYKYRLQRLTWGSWVSSTASQLALTLSIFIVAMFVLGFVADPIINLYLDPVNTITSAGGPTGSLIFDEEPVTWAEHFVKGAASLGLLGFAKFVLTLNPLNWWNMRGAGGMMGSRGAAGGTGRDRLAQISWITIVIGIITFLVAVWKGVRAWARRTLEKAGDRVMDVPGADDEDDEDD